MNKKIREQILSRVYSVYNKKQVKAIVIFGSRARGDFSKDSDYDIAVFTKREKKESIEDDYTKEICFTIISPKTMTSQIKSAHSFIYCIFRDGLPLYQKDGWFNKKKNKILKLRPSKETVKLYLSSALETMLWRGKGKHLSSIEYEDNKINTNKVGFSILMNNGIYPISPHTLSKELIRLNKKYTKIAKTIKYIQEVHYQSRNPKAKKYRREINKLKNFSLKYAKENFPNEYKKIINVLKQFPLPLFFL